MHYYIARSHWLITGNYSPRSPITSLQKQSEKPFKVIPLKLFYYQSFFET